MVSGCAVNRAGQSQAEPAAETMRVRGSLAYRERIALVPGSVVRVTLSDVSLADAPSSILAEQTITTTGQQVPIAFDLAVPSTQLMPRRRYSVRGTIRGPDGALMWTTDTAHPIDVDAGAQDLGVLNLVQVRSSGGEAQADTPLAKFRCGDTSVRASFSGATARLIVAGRAFTLQQVRSASGAKYEGDTGEGRATFWNKGSGATLSVGDATYPQCSTEPSEGAGPLQRGREWVVEDVEGRGVIDGSRVTLSFSADGRVAGLSGCNNYSGGYELAGDQLRITEPLAVTRRLCPPALMTQEERVLAALTGDLGVTTDSTGALVLTGSAGSSLLAR